MTPATARPNLHDAVWAAGILVIIIMSVFQVYDVLRRLDIVLEGAQRELATSARLLAEHTAASLQAVDVLLREYQALPDPQLMQHDTTLQKGLRERVQHLPQLRDLALIPHNLPITGGKAAVPGTPPTPEVLAWLQAAPNGDELRISDPFFVSEAGALTVVLSRRFESGDGHAGGSIIAYLDLEYFRRFYGGLELPPGSRISLLGSNG
ncbi:MAG: cache domain-containing protein, partial [Burkholderiales bacterium]|nr:cache domain-containing protein [Burkholderiales bacterium]MCW5621661.1 cache domain-containing protein [Burkholderiales bacterium]